MNYTYEACEDHIIIDDDKDLTPHGDGIRIDILDLIQRTYKSFGWKPPKDFPKHETMFNYGLAPEDQIFVRQVIPQRLVSLEKHLRAKEKAIKKREQTPLRIELNIINNFWQELEDHQEEYKDEIKWLEKMWYHRLFGAWYLIKGKPLYFPGNFFFFINFSTIPIAKELEYRDRDRRFGIAYKWAILETRTFAKMDKDGIAIPEPDGSYEMIDLMERVFYGGISAKPRRVGDTSKSVTFEIEEATRTMSRHYGNQAESFDSSKRVFIEHVMFQFKRFPVFFKPLFDSVDPQAEIEFKSDDPDLSLGSWISFANSKKGSFYDGSGLAYYMGDEIGKVDGEDIVKRHATIKKSCSERDKINGNIMNASTVEDMTKQSGLNFLQLCKQSKFHQRVGNGQTHTGLICFYFRASDGYTGYIDKYGFSIEYEPTEEQKQWLISHNKQPIGAYQYLLNNRKGLSEEALSQEKRQNPLCFREIFTPPANNNFLPIDRLEKRLTELRFGSKKTISFDLAWTSGFGGNVSIVYPSEGKEGRFICSMLPSKDEQNRFKIIDGVQYPLNPDKYVCSADAFRLDKTNSGRMSNGGIGLRLKRDKYIDPDDKPVKDWVTARQIVYYSYRPDTSDEFCEDVLKLCILFGSLAYNENNVNTVNEYFIKHDFGGYLLYDTDEYGTPKANAGYSANHLKQKGFNSVRNDLAVHCERHDIEELLSECMQILGLEDLTNWDGFAAYLGTLLGEESSYSSDLAGRMDFKYDVSSYFKVRNY